MSFTERFNELAYHLGILGAPVDTGHWQALENVPQTKTIELLNVTFNYDIPRLADDLAADVQPNLPWAESHFQERVAGEPTNPGDTYTLWPFYRGNVERHKGDDKDGKFSHTYQERIWPRWASYLPEVRGEWSEQNQMGWKGNEGIRYRYGDLDDVIKLLARQPFTRQAYLPIWFPEDTGAHHGERVPCTLGYHFIRRGRRLHVFYPIRSCDLLRHFRDDVYLAARLCQWVLNQVTQEEELVTDRWRDVLPGRLSMFIVSLHAFESERSLLLKMKPTAAGGSDDYDFVAAV